MELVLIWADVGTVRGAEALDLACGPYLGDPTAWT
jgi:hypothetical protein